MNSYSNKLRSNTDKSKAAIKNKIQPTKGKIALENTPAKIREDNMDTADVDIIDTQTEVTNAELKELILSMENRLNKRMDTLEEQMNKRIDTLEKQTVDALGRVATSEHKIEELTKSVEYNAGRIEYTISQTIPEINAKIFAVQCSAKVEQLTKEIHDRKQNLLFYGAKQERDEDVYQTVRDFLKTDFDFTEDEATQVFIVNAHRLPSKHQRGGDEGQERGPDPIIVRFACMKDRDFVLTQARNRGFITDRKPVMCYTDLPAQMKRERGKLAAQAKVLRREGKATRIRVVGIKVFLEFRDKNARNSPWLMYAV